jgi:PilZ domain
MSGREQRKQVALTVRIFGTDSTGRVFSDSVSTVNVSFEGAMLTGVHRTIKAGEIIGLTYGKNKARFRVQWVGEAGTPNQGRMGIQNVMPTSCIWDFALQPRTAGAEMRSNYAVARRHARLKCSSSVQLNSNGEPPVWSKAGDLSEGGCFVEMMIPVKAGTRLKISLWLKEDKVVAEGVVVHSRPAYGVGIQFTEMSQRDAERLREFLKGLVRIPAAAAHSSGVI